MAMAMDKTEATCMAAAMCIAMRMAAAVAMAMCTTEAKTEAKAKGMGTASASFWICVLNEGVETPAHLLQQVGGHAHGLVPRRPHVSGPDGDAPDRGHHHGYGHVHGHGHGSGHGHGLGRGRGDGGLSEEASRRKPPRVGLLEGH